ncbi:MAG: phage N-6-adenine-methyltransferase [Alicyclobacillus macrosporangiidus]|uniref:DNA N-6-adenine-methyltransferase n=1 Tax=Alicyclobacillus macrosporangiidus TaxID=392015 RepID=UPI0026EED3EE|nr:DNA N-6-adenine-methyltransferase [Alicyclobacillus macrosporangiidus]MCL6598975.1 phage N-6-adenine-methyltransferase [Alicyclobacillus macrosporangiidus]
MVNQALLSSNRDDWETPWDLFNELDARYHFTLDVCAIWWNAKLDEYFDEHQDGLSQAWSGRCWMNPPYGREIGKWVKKAHDEALVLHNCELVVCLLPARTDTKWFHRYVWDKHTKRPRPGVDVEFLEGRVKFLDLDGNPTNSAPFPSMIVVFQEDLKADVREVTSNDD